MDEADALLRLALVPGLGPVTIERLLTLVAHPAEVFDLPMDRLQTVDGVGPERARKLCDPRSADRVADERARCHAAGVRIVTRDDPGYPRVLRALHDPPVALWLRGEFEPRDALAVAVVGSRRPSAYGHRQAQRLASGLARVGACVISGLARGIDTVAHEAALSVDGARTIAVLGSGFEKLYPDENRPLAERIAAGRGVVLSEFPFGAPPNAGNFPRRNRIVACLALATLVVEAGGRSGALITARLAGELGREVLAVPGPIDSPACAGSNQLIRVGATLITSLDEILEEVEPLMTLAGGAAAVAAHPEPPSRGAALSGREKQVYTLLDDTPRPIDDLCRIGGLPASAVSATLLSLELRRLAKKTAGGYVRAT